MTLSESSSEGFRIWTHREWDGSAFKGSQQAVKKIDWLIDYAAAEW